MDAMVAPDPPRSSRSLGDMLGTSRPPDELVGSLSDQFRVTREEWGALLSELRSGRGLHAFFSYFASGVDPSPGLE